MIMSTSKVIATLEDRKTQTRRIIPQRLMANADIDKNDSSHVYFESEDEPSGYIHAVDCAPYSIGDHAYIRETITLDHYHSEAYFKADTGHALRKSECRERYAILWTLTCKRGYEARTNFKKKKSIPSIHMPKVVAREWVEITGVRVERIQDISEHDSKAEGIEPEIGVAYWRDYRKGREKQAALSDPRDSFRTLWNSLNEERGFGWEVNPYVWVYDFKRIEK